MTRYFPPGLTSAQRKVFENIAIGQLPWASKRTIEVLMARGLIRQVGMRTLGRDALGKIEVPEYEVPVAVHLAWCEWCTNKEERLT